MPEPTQANPILAEHGRETFQLAGLDAAGPPAPEDAPRRSEPEQTVEASASDQTQDQAPGQPEAAADGERTAATESLPLGQPVETSESGSNLATYLAIFGFIVLMYTLLRAYRRSAARRAERGTPKEQIKSVREDAARRGRASVDHAAAETLDMIERLSAQLDNKAARLEMLLAEADQRIDELHRMRRGEPEHRPAEQTERSTPENGADPVRSRVYEMADRGVSAEEIARAVQRPRGQVDLMLALRRV